MCFLDLMLNVNNTVNVVNRFIDDVMGFTTDLVNALIRYYRLQFLTEVR